MYYHIFTDRDATIYEKYPERNTGIDEILQLSKVASGSLLNGNHKITLAGAIGDKLQIFGDGKYWYINGTLRDSPTIV